MKRKSNFKANLTCSNCTKIFQDPIQLPCNDSICAHHLKEAKSLREKIIKCTKCSQTFEIDLIENNMRPNRLVRPFLNEEMYLSYDEKQFKHEIKRGIDMFHKLLDEFTLDKNVLASTCYDHFQEMRFEIDIHREKLKENIDEIALELIERLNAFESLYMARLNSNLKDSSPHYYENMSLELDYQKLDESFREPFLTWEKCKQLQKSQEKMLEGIKLKLKELKQMRKNLEKNKFEPRIPDIGNSFGTLTLKTYTSDHLLTSQILSQSQCMELTDLCEFSHEVKWTLLYRGSRDGFGAHNFHAKCDGKSQTLTLLKAKESKFIFGGFTATDWDSFSKWKNDPHAFLFSLTKREKIQVIPEKSKFAIWCSPSCGPIFGAGRDLAILNNSNLTSCNYSDLGHTYKSLKYEMNLSDSREFFADSRNFKLAEIEVYQKE